MLGFLQHLRHEDGSGHGSVEGLGSAAEVGDGDGVGDALPDLRGEATALVAHHEYGATGERRQGRQGAPEVLPVQQGSHNGKAAGGEVGGKVGIEHSGAEIKLCEFTGFVPAMVP